MTVYMWLTVGLGVVDLALLSFFYFGLRRYPNLNRSILFPVGAGLAGFVFHAFMFFSGAFLFIQLATIMGIFGILLLELHKRSIHSS